MLLSKMGFGSVTRQCEERKYRIVKCTHLAMDERGKRDKSFLTRLLAEVNIAQFAIHSMEL